MRQGMRQGMRFLVRPGTFFNQLQWSSHHWVILLAFAIVASVETHLGNNHLYYQVFADMLVQRFGIPWHAALWAVTSLKLVLFLSAGFAISSLIWLVGTMFGRRTSKRVLFRRLAVVYTVLLGAYTISNLPHLSPRIPTMANVLYFWGALLGFFAIKEQFALRTLEAAFLSLIAGLLLAGSWQYSRKNIQVMARKHIIEVAQAKQKVSSPAPVNRSHRR